MADKYVTVRFLRKKKKKTIIKFLSLFFSTASCTLGVTKTIHPSTEADPGRLLLFFFFFNRNYTRPLFLSITKPEDTHHSQWIYCDVSIHTCTNTHKRTERVKDRGGERARKHSYCRQCYMIKGDGERRGNESSKNGSAADSVSPGSHSLQIHASTHTQARARRFHI